MGKDGDRSGAAESRGEIPEEPDEFDSLVLDEAFIAAGIPEASLPRYQNLPPLPRPVDQQHQSTRPPAARPPRARSASIGSSAPPAWQRRQLRNTGLLLGVVTLLVIGVVLTGLVHLRSGAGAAGAGSILPASNGFHADAELARQQIAGLPPISPDGTCFDVRGSVSSPTVTVQPCAQRHAYELIGQQQLDGADATYPAPSFFSGTVDTQCAHDLALLTGLQPSRWPAGLRIGSLPPTPAGWAAGDRTVYCIAHSAPSTAGSLHQLNSSAAPTA